MELKLGKKLSELRKRKQITLDILAKTSGVSKSILSQLERDISNPTVSTIFRISKALEEPIENFFKDINIQVNDTKRDAITTPSITSKDGKCVLKILGNDTTVDWLQWYLLEMEIGGKMESESHGVNTFENLTVIKGKIKVIVEKKEEEIYSGDTFRFETNRNHEIINLHKGTSTILMINYIDPRKGSF